MRERLLADAFARAADYINATRVRRRLTQAFHAQFSEIDVAVIASAIAFAMKNAGQQPLRQIRVSGFLLKFCTLGAGIGQNLEIAADHWGETRTC